MMPYPWNRKPTRAKKGALAAVSNRVLPRVPAPICPHLPALLPP